MLELYYKLPFAMERVKNSPLNPFVEELVEYFHSQNLSYDYVQGMLKGVTRFGYWLQKKNISLNKLSAKHIRLHIDELTSQGVPISNNNRNGVRYIFNLIQKQYPPRLTPIEKEVEVFLRHLQDNCGVCECYIRGLGKSLLKFLRHFFQDGKISLKSVTPVMVEEYIQGIPKTRANSSRMLCCCALRSYISFLKMIGKSPHQIELGIPIIHGLPRTVSPEVVSSKDMETLLRSIDCTTLEGKAAYAVIICLSELALRAKDVCRLSLDDIDWRSAKIKIRTPKNGEPFYLPLTKHVGKALADYIRHARPKSEFRQVFLRKPHGLVKTATAASLRVIVDRQWKKAGLDNCYSGTRILRHTAATKLVQNGFGLKIIADVLGHSTLASTNVYAQADIPSLRQVAKAWPVPEVK